MEILVKEAAEEASIPEELCSVAKFVGSLEFSRHAGGSLQPEKEFIFDIELPADFQGGELILNFLRVVQTRAILFLNSMSERGGSDIQRI